MNRINWGAVAAHAAVGFGVTLIATAIWWPMVFIAPLITTAVYYVREVYTAKWRHRTTLAEGRRIVMEGEPGWSPWNLRLQAVAPAAGGGLLAVVLNLAWGIT